MELEYHISVFPHFEREWQNGNKNEDQHPETCTTKHMQNQLTLNLHKKIYLLIHLILSVELEQNNDRQL